MFCPTCHQQHGLINYGTRARNFDRRYLAGESLMFVNCCMQIWWWESEILIVPERVLPQTITFPARGRNLVSPYGFPSVWGKGPTNRTCIAYNCMCLTTNVLKAILDMKCIKNFNMYNVSTVRVMFVIKFWFLGKNCLKKWICGSHKDTL